MATNTSPTNPLKRQASPVSHSETEVSEEQIDASDLSSSSSEDDDIGEDEEEEEEEDISLQPLQIHHPHAPLPDQTKLVHDRNAYHIMRSVETEWPALSFEFVKGKTSGKEGKEYPITTTVVTGTQADHPSKNAISILKISNIHKPRKRSEESEDEEDESEEEEDEDNNDLTPKMEVRTIPHYGGINRLRMMPHKSVHIVATMDEERKLIVQDITRNIAGMDNAALDGQNKLLHTATHKQEGFALDWSKTVVGNLLSGSCDGSILLHSWGKERGSQWNQSKPYVGHKKSVEDLQWSPSEATVFASCSADGDIRIWDTRQGFASQLTIQASTVDVNVMSWNHLSSHLLASGDDNGCFKVWDLRNVMQQISKKKGAEPAASFSWHKDQITSIEWHPTDDSCLAVSGADNVVSLWDLSVEREGDDETANMEIPSQLMFTHQGHQNVKEVHWNSDIPGLLGITAESGIGLIRPINF